MIEQNLLATLLGTHYPLQPAAITIMRQADPNRSLYHVTTADHADWLVRLYRAGAASPPWLNVPNGETWFRQQALILEWCARQAYPAPRILHTHTGDLVATFTNWHVLVTQFLQGTTQAETLQARQNVAALLSQLHQRSAEVGTAELQALPWSWWGPVTDAITRAQQLFVSLTAVPTEWETIVDACQAALQQSLHLQSLPETLIHGDCWMGNAVTSTASESTLIDWEYAGRGIALLDLGNLLNDCFRYSEETLVVNDAGIAAVIDGYERFRPLSSEEADALMTTIRFGIAFRTAIRCHLAQQVGWGGGIHRGLAREQARFAISERVAQTACRYIKH